MDTADVLIDAYGRIRELVHASVDTLDEEALTYRVDADANSIAWLIWHLTRIQDHHVSHIADRGQAWIENRWFDRFGMEPDPENTGFGHTSDEVAAVRPDRPETLVAYHDEVWSRTVEYLRTINADELDRIVDDSWDPPVSAGVRLVSVVSDNLQHAGQAHYVQGVYERVG